MLSLAISPIQKLEEMGAVLRSLKFQVTAVKMKPASQ